MDGNQLYIKATAKSEESKNRIWDAIKRVDPNFTDLKHDIQVDHTGQSVQPGQTAQTTGGGQQTYTVQAGDNLSEISKHFYGDANKYNKIVEANKLADPDKIKAGQQLIIPAA